MVINILEYLEHSATLYPDKVALADDKLSLTFAQWQQQAESIGTLIAQTTNCTVRCAVLVFVDRRVEGLVGAMGVVESGNFYVPIDCRMPFERVRLIADVCKPIAAIVTVADDLKTLDQIEFTGHRLVYNETKDFPVDKQLLTSIREQIIDLDPVYSIFTSGSTGVPKGVLISHRGMMDFADFLVERFGLTEEDVLANQAPFYFDCSVKDIGICLRAGATLNIIPKKCFAFPKLLIQFLNERNVTCLFWATSAVILVANTGILDEKKPLYLKHVSFGGEAMPAKQLNNWRNNLPEVQYINVYGPTEVTVDCTYYVVDRDFKDGEYVPIGINIPNKQVLVLNDDDKLVAVGEVGEICCRGTGVSMGYYNNREKTNSVFVQNPLHNLYNDIIYRTGDLGKWNEHGELEFVSRKDFQVKHKGNRIELGEIEVAVNAIEGVTNAACIFDQLNDKIVLYYTTSDGQPCDIINLVKERIPVYMFPEVVNHLIEMPYNMNGKIDRVELKKRYEKVNYTFRKVDLESLKRIINGWQDKNKSILSNFYGIDEEGVYDVMEGNNTLVLRKQESDFYRVYIMSADIPELSTLLGDMGGVDYVINIPSRKPIDEWDELLKSCGFEYYETYSRICNPKVATMKKRETATGEYAKESDLDDIVALLSENFSLYTAHLPSRNSMLQLIRERQIFVDRYPNGKVCGVNISNIKGPVGYGIVWIDKGEHGLDLQFDMFNHFIDHGVKRLVGWVRDSNVKVVKMHLRMGAIPDGLKDYTYTKLVKK